MLTSLPVLAARVLTRRALRWTAAVAAAIALLALLIDWVELGARAAPGAGLEPLRGALLLLPGHLGQAAPLVAALGAALAVAGLRRSGEWLAFEGVGLSAARRLGPLLAVGIAVGLACAVIDNGVTPRAERARHNLLAVRADRPLRSEEGAWLTLDDAAIEVRGDDLAAGRIAVLGAWRVRGGRLEEAWRASDLRWDAGRWTPGAAEPPWLAPGLGTPATPPWTTLPPPSLLAERIGSLPVRARTWPALGADPGPEAAAERHARWSRAAACGVAAVVGAAVPALLGPGSLAVLAAAAPVLAWESLATGVQAQAAAARVPAWTPALARLALALGLALGLLRRMERVP